MSKKAWSGAVGAVALTVVAGWLVSNGALNETQQPSEVRPLQLFAEAPQGVDAERAANAAAQEYIAAESEALAEGTAGPTAPAVEAPPGFVAALPSAAQSPQPPAGYSFTAFHGEMRKGRLPVASDANQALAEADATYAWLAAAGTLRALAEQPAERAWTFGWVGVERSADVALVADALAGLGGEVLGRNADLLRARLPRELAKLRRIAALPGVSGVAPTPARLKAPASLLERAAVLPLEQTPSFITLMTDDPRGVWRRALAELGAVVGHFDVATRVYAANVPNTAFAALVAADFVLAVEPVGILKPAHESAVPAMGADALRMFDSSTRLFSGTGGGAVPVGVLDTGLNIEHVDIASNRASICGGNFVPGAFTSARSDDLDLWVDVVGHGSHVTGTIVGNGSVEPRFAGMAPLVQHIRFGKVLGSINSTTAVAIGRGMDFLAEASSCGPSPAPAKPLLVNMSLGLDGVDWEGRSALERKLDATVWQHRQLYVVAAGNSAFRGRGDVASAKNALTVGAATHGGDIAAFSSHGPTLDDRLRPQIVGTGVGLVSVAGDGSRKGYAVSSGTSMASPSVAGVAALLMDAVPEFREQPAAVRARLIASAIRPDAFLEDIALFPLHAGDGPGPLQNQYGLGKVSARTAVLSRDAADGWVSGSAIVDIGDGEYAYQDIEVPAGASRLDIAMTWDEPPADTLAQPLLNDLDLWVDRDADCPASQPAACGNAASRSRRDNVEWLILRNPQPGTYRLKAVPRYARVQTPRAALAWTIIRGPSTPQLAVTVDQQSIAAGTDTPFAVDVTITSDGYVAAGTVLRVDCRSANEGNGLVPAVDGAPIEGGQIGLGAGGLPNSCARAEYLLPRASSASREDNVPRTLDREGGDGIFVGEVAVGEEQRVRLMFPGSEQPEHLHLYFTATAWNANAASASVAVAVGAPDGSPPALANAPANDNFADAVQIRGVAGETTFDLLLATPEPGEPPFTRGLINEMTGFPQQAVRPRSVWYAWRAPRTDAYRFGIAPSALDDYGDVVQIDLFEVREDDALASLASIDGKSGGGMTFQAHRGQAYRIRLSVAASSLRPPDDPFGPVTNIPRRIVMPLALAWSKAERPGNDDFRFAARLTGETGSVDSSNLGATPEQGEPLGALAATTWHRWTAPASGDWEFAVNRTELRVAAFVGDDVGSLRLVSGPPDQTVAFPVQAGMTYHIVVAAPDAFVSGSDFTLRWGPGERFFTANDDVANAEPLLEISSFYSATVDFAAMTVEPGEPMETGTRTAWWSWTAPEDGDYAIQGEALSITLRLSVFAGDDFSNLVLLGSSRDADTAYATVTFTAQAGERYLLAAGLPPASAFATVGDPSHFSLMWGQLPGNDDFANASVLDGMAGSVSGSTLFATVEAGERTGTLGDASTWWVWEAPEEAWYRFSLRDAGSGTVAIFKDPGDGGPLELVATGHRVAETADIALRAEAGARYAIRVGSGGELGPFSLDWVLDGPPAWLRFAGVVQDGDVDADGALIRMSGVQALAFNDDGSQLFAASLRGLQRYERDAAEGALRVGQTISGIDSAAALRWDARTRTLLAGTCDGWLAFAADEDGTLQDGVPLGGVAPCPGDAMLWDSTNTFLHVLQAPAGLGVYALDAERSSFALVGFQPIDGIQAATLSADDGFLFAATSQATLGIYARDAATGALALRATLPADEDSEDAGQVMEALYDVRLLAVDASNRYLLAFGQSGLAAAAFDLADVAAPQLLATASAFTRGWVTRIQAGITAGCRFVSMRAQTLAADVACIDAVYSVRLTPSAPLLRAEDDVYSRGEDRFGNIVPFYYSFDSGVAASPDGKHIYVGNGDGLLLFERVGAQ